SLITRSTKPWTIYFGIPAKPLKPRQQDMVGLAEQYMRELDES
ncbi:MAG: acyltransferase, partial [Planctomycetaceae bacterium]|nr:acyltransferase [Planctomycetaceae bacterium]